MPAKSVITIAMTDGSCAEEIAAETARRLGYRYLNVEIIDRAAALAGVDPATVAATEHSEPLVARILRNLAAIPVDTSGYVSPELLAARPPDYRALIRRVMRSAAEEGSAVIGAHAAGMTLAGMPGLLRVLVTAPLEVRVQRVAAERQVEPGAARKAVEHADAERRRYLQSFVHVGDEHPTHYDLVLSTEVLTPEQAVSIIVAAAD